MKKEILQKRFKKEWRALLKNLDTFSQIQDPDAIHEMRVRLKKIIAITKLAQSCAKNSDYSRPLKPILALFKEAGPVRDGFVYLKLINRFPKNVGGLKEKQRNLVKDLSAKFSSSIGSYYKIMKKTDKIILHQFEDLKTNCIEELYQKKLDTLIHLFSKPNNLMVLHDCRKKIKSIIYGYEIMNKKTLKNLPLNIIYLQKLQEMIGRWHDSEMSMKLLAGEGFANSHFLSKMQGQNDRMIRSIHLLTTNFQKKAISKR